MTSASQKTQLVPIRRVDDDRRIVEGQVYAPYQLDSQGDFMLPEDIEKMAHRFMRLHLAETIDTMHDNVPNGCYPIESWIVRGEHPEYDEGAWIVAVQIVGDELWEQVKSGQINAYSFQAMARPVEMEADIMIVRDHVGTTEPADDGHTHVFFCHLDIGGRVVKGWTSPGPDGHVHFISRSSVTEEESGHSHRFFV